MNDLKRRIELCKLIIARDSMDSVAEASGLAIANKIDHTHPLYKALHAAIVSSYGRAFTEMQPLGKLPKRWSKFDDEQLQKTHKMLMYYRHKNVSHTDVINGRVMLHPMGSHINEHTVAPTLQYSVLFQTFAANELIAVQKLAGNIAGRLIAEIETSIKSIYGESGEKIDSNTELITEQEIEELRDARLKLGQLSSLLRRVRRWL